METILKIKSKKRKLLVSSCLLGEAVRYDGSDKKDPKIFELLSDQFEFVSFCPEVYLGLGVPREPIDLFQTEQGLKLIDSKTGEDYAPEGIRLFTEFLNSSKCDGVVGAILKSRSPSCGVGSTPIYTQKDKSAFELGEGLFSQVIKKHKPDWKLLDSDHFTRDQITNL